MVAQHMRTRTAEDYVRALIRARIRRERRLLRVMKHQGWFPSPQAWRDLDLVHEATFLFDRLERRTIAENERRAQWGDR